MRPSPRRAESPIAPDFAPADHEVQPSATHNAHRHSEAAEPRSKRADRCNQRNTCLAHERSQIARQADGGRPDDRTKRGAVQAKPGDEHQHRYQADQAVESRRDGQPTLVAKTEQGYTAVTFQ